MNWFALSAPAFLGTLLLCVMLDGATMQAAAQEPELDVAPPSVVVGQPEATPLTGSSLETETERVAALVRCPVCQGLSVFDSPAPMAVKMRKQIRELLAEGYSERQILSYFERSYGEFVLLEPPLRGINWVVWLAPVLLLLGGAAVVVRLFRHRPSGASPGEKRSEADDDAYLRRVRELAYGETEERT